VKSSRKRQKIAKNAANAILGENCKNGEKTENAAKKVPQAPEIM
jgi:hypothetical protein